MVDLFFSGGPGFFDSLLLARKVVYFAVLLGGFGFLPLLSPWTLAPALPSIAISLLSSEVTHTSIQSQYSAAAIGPLFAGLLAVLARRSRQSGDRAMPGRILAGLVVVAVSLSVALGPAPWSLNFWSQTLGRQWHYTQYLPDRQAALDEAERLMRDEPATAAEAVIVVVLPDGGRNYLSKLYNDEWMRANGLLATTGAVVRVAELIGARHHGPDIPDVVLARTTDRVGAAIDLLQLYGISQLPVSEQADGDALEGIVGSVSEKGLLERTYRNPEVVERTVGEVMDRPLPTLDVTASVDQAFALLSSGAPALLAIRGRRPAGVVTKLDLLEYLAHSR